MKILHVKLTNFRNYRNLEVALPSTTTLLWGDNAAGKSSFLEALHMLATTRSPRASAEREVIHWDAPMQLGIPPFTRVVGRVQRQDGPLTVEMTVQRRLDAEGHLSGRCQKRFLVNRRAVPAREAAGRLQVVLFEPEDLNLITGSPARRRRFLDTTLMQADPLYWKALRRYQRVLSQRNRLLRRWRETGSPQEAQEQIRFWNREMVQKGAYIIVARHRLIQTLAPHLEELHGRLAGVPERFALTYLPQISSTAEDDEESVAYAFGQEMAKLWNRERERGMTLIGPHRADIGFSLGEMDLATYGSRGQQRTATIALKLAEVEWMRRQGGETPVVLLDDVLSELDPERRAHLQTWLLEGGCQVIVTTTDLGDFRRIALEQGTIFRVAAGQWQQHEPDLSAEASADKPSDAQ